MYCTLSPGATDEGVTDLSLRSSAFSPLSTVSLAVATTSGPLVDTTWFSRVPVPVTVTLSRMLRTSPGRTVPRYHTSGLVGPLVGVGTALTKASPLGNVSVSVMSGMATSPLLAKVMVK
ncbi:MAG: hypothetical protein BWZ02_01658 [Lentisphaerae bacterium ADurb.BinA184]|nr:MAG: hypothetical protein BWZ02_01658 [Lentisphaerae bacterium ADurb.BinA184]